MELDPDSLERCVPDELSSGVTGHETMKLHLERYELAARHAQPGRALDLACGVGYGTRLLFDRCAQIREIVGVDISPEATRYARTRYGAPGIEYRTADALAFDDRDGFDTVVSLETIEHVTDPARMIDRLVALVRPGGVLIGSVPTTLSTDVNPHHLSDFTERSFRRLVARPALAEVASFRQRQPYSAFSIAAGSEPRMSGMRPDLVRYYATHPGMALRRLATTLRFGFANRYLTIVWRKH